jgi:AcrR family transcriptional regulator
LLYEVINMVKKQVRRRPKPSSARREARGAPAGEAGTKREALLRAALDALAGNTFDTESLAQLAARAGVSQPLVSYYFASREELWREAMARAFEELAAAQRESLEELAGLPVRQRLERFIRRFVRFSARTPALAAAILSESLRGGERLRWIVEHNLGPLHRQMDALLEEGVRAGELRPLPAAHVTHALVGACTLFLTAPALVQGLYPVDPLRPEAVQAHADTVVTLLLRGLLTPEALHPETPV